VRRVGGIAPWKVWAADPLACPKCGGQLRIISFIEEILRHLKL
jgi:hypothetical protein